jgi:hypothetical protein
LCLEILKQPRHQRIPPVLAEARELPRHAGALGRQSHGRLTFLVDVLLDEAIGLDLLEDGLEIGVVVQPVAEPAPAADPSGG